METTLEQTQETSVIPFDPKELHQAMMDAATSRIKIYPRHSIWASQIDHPCLRFNEYAITRWQDQLPINPELQLIFDKGRDEEKIVLRNLEDAGFENRQAQRPLVEILNKNGTKFRYKISGKLDLEITHQKYLNGIWYPAEIKSMSPFAWDSIDTLDDMIHHKQYYIRMYPSQLISYLLIMGQELGIMILENKVTNMLKFIPVPLDYNTGERILSNGETINMVVEAIEKEPEKAEDLLSPRIEFDEKICSRCPFGHICLPNANFGGVSIDLDPETEGKLVKREELKVIVKQYEELDEEVKTAFKARGVGKYMVGAGFNVSVEQKHKDSYTTKPGDYVQVNIKAVKK